MQERSDTVMPQCSRPLESCGIEIKQIAGTFALKSKWQFFEISRRYDFRVTSVKQQRYVISSNFDEIATRCDIEYFNEIATRCEFE